MRGPPTQSGEDGPAAPRAPPHARQRLLHKAPELDCAFEAICEACAFFQTSIDFRPTLQAQHDHAAAHNQDQRGQLFASLPARIAKDAS